MADVETVQIEPTNGQTKTEVEVSPKKAELVKEEEDISEADSQSDFTQLEKDIIKQIEYYFSENNLRRDKFLIAKIAENEDGFVDISVLLTFNRLKTITEDAKAIVDAMEKSPHGTVQLSEDKLKLRRHPDNPLPEFNETRKKELQARTAYAKGFPLDSTLTQLIEYFHKNFDNVEQVMMRKYFCPKTKNHLFKGSVFVTFSNREFSDKFVNKAGLKYLEKELLRYTQSKYIEIKKVEREEAEKKKKLKKEAKELAADKEAFALPKAAVVHFTVKDGGEMSREDIKESIAEIDASLEIAYIHFQKGDKEGDLRFSKENNAKTLLEKLEDGKMKIKEAELTINLLEGEAEEKFLEKAIADMKQRRSKFQKGGKGKQHFTRKRKHDGDIEHKGKKTRD